LSTLALLFLLFGDEPEHEELSWLKDESNSSSRNLVRWTKRRSQVGRDFQEKFYRILRVNCWFGVSNYCLFA